MSQQQFESQVKVIPYTQSQVYTKLSDLNNLEQVRERFSDPNVQSTMASQMSEDKIQQIRENLKNLRFDSDMVACNIPPVGEIALHIIEREEPKCIKFETTKSPIPLNLWIQILPHGEGECKIKLTIKADINPFMKMMVSKPLKDGVDKLADVLAMIPYGV